MSKLGVALSASVLFVALWSVSCLAGPMTTDPLDGFFQPVTATVIMPLDSGILVDKGASDGIAPGDILTLITAEKPIVHPQTGQLLDTQTEYGTYFTVTRVKTNLSYCKSHDPNAEIPEGARVRRFGNVPIYFVDPAASGFQLFRSLREKHPQLLWKDYLTETTSQQTVQQPALFVRYTPRQILIRNQDQQTLFALSLGTGAEKAEVPAPATATAVTSSAAVTTGLTPSTGSTMTAVQGPREWMVQRFALPGKGEVEAVKTGDLDHDGQTEVLVGMDGDVILGRLAEGVLTEIARIPADSRQQIVDISTLDIDADGNLEVVVSALKENRAIAWVYEFAGNRLLPVAETGMLLATFKPLKGEPILVGLNNSAILNLQPQFFRVNIVNGELVTTPLDMGPIRQPYGVVSSPGADQERLLISLSEQGRLRVTDSSGQVRSESAEGYGGSDKGIKVAQPGSRNVDDFEMYFLNSRIQKTVRGTILVARHDGPGLFRNNPEYENGRLVEVVWNGTTLEEVAESPSLGGMLVDFDQFERSGDGLKVLVGMNYRKEGFFQEALSGLVVLSMKQ